MIKSTLVSSLIFEIFSPIDLHLLYLLVMLSFNITFKERNWYEELWFNKNVLNKNVDRLGMKALIRK